MSDLKHILESQKDLFYVLKKSGRRRNQGAGCQTRLRVFGVLIQRNDLPATRSRVTEGEAAVNKLLLPAKGQFGFKFCREDGRKERRFQGSPGNDCSTGGRRRFRTREAGGPRLADVRPLRTEGQGPVPAASPFRHSGACPSRPSEGRAWKPEARCRLLSPARRPLFLPPVPRPSQGKDRR